MKTKSVVKRLFAVLLSATVTAGLFSTMAYADIDVIQGSEEKWNEYKKGLTVESELKGNNEEALDVSSWGKLSNEYIECVVKSYN